MSSILQDKEVTNNKSPATTQEKTGLEGSTSAFTEDSDQQMVPMVVIIKPCRFK